MVSCLYLLHFLKPLIFGIATRTVFFFYSIYCPEVCVCVCIYLFIFSIFFYFLSGLKYIIFSWKFATRDNLNLYHDVALYHRQDFKNQIVSLSILPKHRLKYILARKEILQCISEDQIPQTRIFLKITFFLSKSKEEIPHFPFLQLNLPSPNIPSTPRSNK